MQNGMFLFTECKKQNIMTDTGNDKINVLGKQTNWEDLYF